MTRLHARAVLDYPFAAPATDGSVVEVAPGILWARMPMPMALDHINVYLLRGDDGWTLIDTGLHTDIARERWEHIAANHLQGLPVVRLVCTHMHYDHAGLARWLCERFGIPLLMTHGEFFMMRALSMPRKSCEIMSVMSSSMALAQRRTRSSSPSAKMMRRVFERAASNTGRMRRAER